MPKSTSKQNPTISEPSSPRYWLRSGKLRRPLSQAEQSSGTPTESTSAREMQRSLSSIDNRVSERLPTVAETLAESLSKGIVEIEGGRLSEERKSASSIVEFGLGSEQPRVYALGPEGEKWSQVAMTINEFLSEDVEAVATSLLRTHIQDAKEHINRFSLALQAHATCYLCSNYMTPVYTLQCGHSYCGTCLLASFTDHLTTKITALANMHGTPQDYIFPIPTNTIQKEQLLQNLGAYHEDPKKYFVYPCPSDLCDVDIRKPPVLSYGHGALNKAMLDVVEKHVAQVLQHGIPSQVADFRPLFL